MADVGRATLPAYPAHVPRPGRQDYRHAAWDRQRWAGPHAGGSEFPQGKGWGSCGRPSGSSGQGRQEVER